MKLSEKIINANIKDKKYSFETGYSIVLIIFGLIINIIILNWLNNISFCKCSKLNNDNNILKILSLFLIIWKIFILIMFILYDGNPESYPSIIKFMIMIVMLITVVYLIKLFIYIQNLRNNKCHCGLLHQEQLIYYYLLIQFGLAIFIIISLLIITMYFVRAV